MALIISLFILGTVPFLGIMKVFVGLSRNGPVGFLVLELLVSVGIAVFPYACGRFG